jgi:hypothetical protein
MNINTRGVAVSTSSSTLPRQVFSGHLGTTLLISKFVYSDVVLYSIRESGSAIGLVAKFHDAMVIRAWNPDTNGELRAWSARLRNGSELVASASRGALTSISIKQ